MKKSIKYKHRIFFIGLLLCSSILFAQKKVESFNVSNDVVVEVNTTHTNVIFETWNKDKVEVEAFIEAEILSKEEKQEILDQWDFEVLGNSKTIKINSSPSSVWSDNNNLHFDLDLENLSELSELIVQPILESLQNIDIDAIPLVQDFPQWPFSNEELNVKNGDDYTRYHFKKGIHITFDTNDYKKDKQKYVTKLNKKYNTNVSVKEVDNWLDDLDDWSDSFEDAMEDWGENFGNKFEAKFGKDFEIKMEDWGENFEEQMEEWGEILGENLEKWAEQFGEDVEKWAEQFDDESEHHNKVKNKSNQKTHTSKKAKKTIIIRMPKGTKTNINVRHGNLKLADAYNVQATLNYGTLTANSIDGGKTSISASYAPIKVNNWLDGDLHIKYVEDCKINKVRKINLNANSSDVIINRLEENAFLTGSFGNLFINDIASNFKAIDIVLENTDAIIQVPNTAFSFYYNGKKSKLNCPSSFKLEKTINGSQVLQKGFYKSSNSQKNITVNANYSNVTLKSI